MERWIRSKYEKREFANGDPARRSRQRAATASVVPPPSPTRSSVQASPARPSLPERTGSVPVSRIAHVSTPAPTPPPQTVVAAPSLPARHQTAPPAPVRSALWDDLAALDTNAPLPPQPAPAPLVAQPAYAFASTPISPQSSGSANSFIGSGNPYAYAMQQPVTPSTNPFFGMQQQQQQAAPYPTMLPTPAQSPYNPFLAMPQQHQAPAQFQPQYAPSQQPAAYAQPYPYGQPAFQWGPS